MCHLHCTFANIELKICQSCHSATLEIKAELLEDKGVGEDEEDEHDVGKHLCQLMRAGTVHASIAQMYVPRALQSRLGLLKARGA